MHCHAPHMIDTGTRSRARMPFTSAMTSEARAELDDRLRTIAGWLAVLVPVGLVAGRVGTELALIPLCFVFVAHILVAGDFRWLWMRWGQFILALWFYMLLRTAMSDATLFNLGEAAATVRYGIFAVALATWILPDPLWQRRVAISAALSAGFLAADAILQFARGTDLFGRPMIGDRLTATYSFPRVGIMLAWLAPLGSLGLYDRGWHKTALGIYVLALSAIVLSGERAAFLTITLFTVAIGVILLKSRKTLLATAIGLVVLVATLLTAFPYVFDRQIKSTADGIVNLDRTHYGIIWERAITMAAASPLTGYGYNAYAAACTDAEFGPQKMTSRRLMSCANHPHNVYLEFLVGLGLLGLGLFAAFVVAAGRQIWQARHLFGVVPVFTGLVILLAIRLFPLNTSTEFFRAWSAVPFWLHVGWILALASAPALSRADKSNT